MLASIKAGWHPPWSTLAPAFTGEQLRKTPSDQLARQLFANGIPARQAFLYDDPNLGMASLEVGYPGYAELFSRPDCGRAIFQLAVFYGAQLAVNQNDQNNLNDMMGISSLPTVEKYPPVQTSLVGQESELIQAHLQALKLLRLFVHAASPSHTPSTTQSLTSVNFSVPAADALIDASLFFGNKISPKPSSAAQQARPLFRGDQNNPVEVAQYLDDAIRFLQPLGENSQAR